MDKFDVAAMLLWLALLTALVAWSMWCDVPLGYLVRAIFSPVMGGTWQSR